MKRGYGGVDGDTLMADAPWILWVQHGESRKLVTREAGSIPARSLINTLTRHRMAADLEHPA